MVSFESDYIAGAHPEVLKALMDTNLEQLPGYGTDKYSESAKEKIRAACECPDADVEFLVGGTQTNAVVISTLLKDYEGVIAADTGHVSTHEAGAIEHSGHKVLALPHVNGKLEAQTVKEWVERFYADGNHEHMVFPGMVYISHPTEYGTLYSKAELEELSAVCRRYDMQLYLDGARLAYGLASKQTDVTLPDIAKLCDVFYIGGTKCGALCGEAVVFTKNNKPHHFALLMCDKEAIEVQKILPFLSDTWPLCRIGRAVIRASQSCRQSCNKSQCPACGCRSHHSCTHAPQFSRSFPAREWGSVLQRQGACGQCP